MIKTNVAQPPIPYDYLGEVPPMVLTSDDIAPDTPMNALFTAAGDPGNVSPHLAWAGFPPETRSFALTVFDPDAPTGSGFWHWLAFDLPAAVTSVERNAGVPGAALRQGRNDGGGRCYLGPCPPPGHGPHRYVFAVHALDVDSLEVDDDASAAYIGFTIGVHALARGVLVATSEVPGDAA